MTGHAWDRVPIDAQSIEAPLSQAAIFLVVGVNEGGDALAKVRDLLGGIDDLVKSVGFRDLSARLSCIVGIGSELWDRMGAPTKPRELKPFAAVEGTRHKAPATPGDLLFHIRAERPDFCFEFERILLRTLGSAVTMIDEVSGFRYFDARDLLGFVDGTANPVGHEIGQSALVGDEDSDFVGGSYVVVQKYLHDLAAWGETSTDLQEKILAVPLVSCTIGKARCLCSFFQKLHSPLFGGQSRSRSRPCAEKGEKGEQRKGKGKAKQNTKYDSRTASRAWLEKENGTCIVMKCVSYSVYPYLQMLWKLTMDSALFLTTTKLKPPISYWT